MIEKQEQVLSDLPSRVRVKVLQHQGTSKGNALQYTQTRSACIVMSQVGVSEVIR